MRDPAVMSARRTRWTARARAPAIVLLLLLLTAAAVATLGSRSGAAESIARGARVVVFRADDPYDARAAVVAGHRGRRVVVLLERVPGERQRRRRVYSQRHLRPLRARPAAGPRARPTMAAWRTVASAQELQAAVREAPPNASIELRGGAYPDLAVNARRSSWATIRPVAGQQVTFSGLTFGRGARFVRVEDVSVGTRVTIGEGASDIQLVGSRARGVRAEAGSSDLLIEGNVIEQADSGVELISTNCSVHNAPETCSAERTLAPVERVTIRNNRITAPEENGITVANFRQVLIEGNEISGLRENGQHSDALQSLWGGAGLVFRRNYIHDMAGNQGFFIKDGRVANVTVDNNLIVRTRPRPGYDFAGSPLAFYDTVPDARQPFHTGHGIVISRNTIWDNAHFLVISGPDNRRIAIRHNVTQAIAIEDVSRRALRANGILQDFNVIGSNVSWGRAGRHDRLVRPRFRDRASGDYRITRAQQAALGFRPGVTWAP
jgi:hypothetical protein